MPNILDASGLTTSTKAELIASYTAAFQQIYGADINLDQDSPDGQMMNIFVQSVLDLQDLLKQIYNQFDPDNAIGVVLDQRVAINGIQREAGTYTITNITIVTNQSVNLYGLDQTVQQIYTVSDNAGNLWELQTTQLGVVSGTNVFVFRAATPGANLTVPNTITTPVTIVLGVVSINNPTVYTTLGTNEETDAALKIRRQKSVSLASQGYLPGLLAALENINGLSYAAVYENVTSTTDVDGIPGHSIWVIVAGVAANSDIAQAIYTKRNAGCGMKGSTTFTITQVDGSLFVIKWDIVVPQNLFIQFTATSINGSTAPNIAGIRAGLPAIFLPGVNQDVNINTLSTLVQQIDSNTLVTNAGFTLGLIQILNLSGVAVSGAFEIFYNGNTSASINWNDAIGVIQSKVQAVPGLNNTLVTGSIASQTLHFDLTAEPGGVLALITVLNNTLGVSISFTYDEGYTVTLSPSTKKNQFVISSADTIILPMLLTPQTSTRVTATTQTMVGLGGYGAIAYSFQTNNSGGTINSVSGLYTAGGTTSVTDTILVTDSMGNTATATVFVTV